jgi:hypothetical protein
MEALSRALLPIIEAALEKTYGARLQDAETSILALKDENAALHARLLATEKRLDDIETETRQDTILFSGLKEDSYAERASLAGSTRSGVGSGGGYAAVEGTAIKFCRDHLKVAVEPKDISVAYRLKAKKVGGIRPLVVRFSSKKIRDDVYKARRELRDSGLSVFMSEHLTKLNSELFYKARLLLKDKKIASTWTQGGHVHIKLTKELSEKPKLIHNHDDLPN